MPGTEVQAGILTRLENEGSGCGSLRQAMVLQMTGFIPVRPRNSGYCLQNSGSGPWSSGLGPGTQAASPEFRH